MAKLGGGCGVTGGGCATSAPAAGCGGCATGVPFPTNCNAARKSPFRMGTSSCSTRGGSFSNLGNWGRSRTQGWGVGGRRVQSCSTGPGNACGGSYGAGYNRRLSSLFSGRGRSRLAGACNSMSGAGTASCGNGGNGGNSLASNSLWGRSSAAYQARNARLSKHLFGWLVPSGNGGMGSPPFGKYHVTYAQDANYFDQRDGGFYGAQGLSLIHI